jgi:uncharacterized protein (TIGR02246 family)
MTLDRAAFQAWLDRYIAAWRSNDPAQVADLFSEEATYRHRPTDEPLHGRAAIVADWTDDPDDPATWQAAYAPLAIDGEVHVASGESSYVAADGTPEYRYANVFVCRFDADGRCTDFTEWWTLDRRFDA